MSAFTEGQRMGMSAMQAGWAEGRAMEGLREARRRTDLEDDARTVQQAIQMQHANRLKQQMQMDQQVRLEDARRMLRADDAFAKFSQELNTLDKGAFDFPGKYADLTMRYAPVIAEHEAVRRKFDALDSAVTAGTDYADSKANRASLQQLVRDLAVYGQAAEASAIQADVKSGKMTATDGLSALNFALGEAKRARAEQERKTALESKIAETTAVEGAKAAAQRENEATVTVESLPTKDSPGVTRKLTAEQFKQEQAEKSAAAERAKVEPLLKTYHDNRKANEEGRGRTGFLWNTSHKALMDDAERKLLDLGYDTDGNKIERAKPIAKPSGGGVKVGRFTVEVE